jgi:sugar phosphate isomerase/epimerase
VPRGDDKVPFMLGLVTSAFFNWEAGARAVTADLERLLCDRSLAVLEIGDLPDRTAAEQVARSLAAAGVRRVYSPGGPIGSRSAGLSAADVAERGAAIEAASRIIDRAVQAGAGILAMAPGRDPGEADRPAALARLADSVTRLASYAADRSAGRLTLAIETMDREIHRRQILGPTAQAAAFIRGLRTGSRRVGLLIDLSHIPMIGETAGETIAAAADTIAHVHVGNCVIQEGHPLYGDSHPPFGEPGGEVGPDELMEFLARLLAAGFFARADLPFGGPAISLEIVPPAGECPFAAIAAARATLYASWERAAAH